jgi:16S rRNA processing protein RimM
LKRGELIPIGKIVRTHGIHGKFRVAYYNQDKTNFFSYKAVLVRGSDGDLEPFQIVEASVHHKFIIVRLQDIDHIDQAERLVGAEILVEETDLPKLDEDEYYWNDLIGMKVTTTIGDQLGEVLDILPTGGTDVLVIKRGQKEVLVPATEEWIETIDLPARRLVLYPIENLTGDDSI